MFMDDKQKKDLIIISTILAIIFVMGIILAMQSPGGSFNDNVVDTSANVAGGDDSGSSDYYTYDFKGYTFNIPSDYYSTGEEYNAQTQFTMITFKNDAGDDISIDVLKDSPNLNKDTAMDFLRSINGSNVVLSDESFADINGWGGDIINSTYEGHAFIFFSGNDAIFVGGSNCDLNKILENIKQKDLPDAPSSSAQTESMSYSQAASYLSGASSTVVQNTFDEADKNGDGILTGSEISEFKRLADLTDRTADKSNTENVEAQDQGAGDGTTKTRYCTTHGRVAVGSDNRCPYCEAEGLDSRTVKGSTEYV